MTFLDPKPFGASRPPRSPGRRLIVLGLLLLISPVLGTAATAAPGKTLERIVLALYDGEKYPDVRGTPIHRMAEMPLNHLGLKVRYHDIHQPMPDVAGMKGVRGVLTWFEDDRNPNPKAFVAWAENVMKQGVRWVIFGDLGIHHDGGGKDTSIRLLNRYLARLGLHTDGRWETPTYDIRLRKKTPGMVEFERAYEGILPPFLNVRAASADAVTHLAAEWGKGGASRSALVITGPQGGYAQTGYTALVSEKRLLWLVNPFEFFRQTFATDQLPKPDTTTLSGRRIYYSHIDGDGWRNRTEIEVYSGKLSTEVILKEAIEPYSDLPVTVSAIAGDLDPEWYGSEAARAAARKIFALDQVEAATHTYSHPFDWNYFGDSYNPLEEWRDFWSQQPASHHWRDRYPKGAASAPKPDLAGQAEPREYPTPRAYGNFPFDLKQEIGGSVRALDPLLPPGKQVELILWTGDTWVSEAALREASRLGLKNLNGGDTRLDHEFPSCGWVSPIGVALGGGLQIYASASNENNYTHLWQDRFYGFRHLHQTLENTESPRRLKPMNIYYHMYSGQKEASLRALLDNLNYARAANVAPVSASHYAAIAEGFYSTELISMGASEWRVKNRGRLNTLRFDDASGKAVDFEHSHGVVGQRHYQGSLYVALDADAREPVVALKGHPANNRYATSARPYLLEGRWEVRGLSYPRGALAQFTARGYGKGTMRWKVPHPGMYQVRIEKEGGWKSSITAKAGDDGLLSFTVDAPGLTPVRITLGVMDEVL
ncbi:MAG: hypothetical protein JSU88_12745 [Nitrospinaceae bacterium]|nr:MAG: hypothetical protein JSU88_12745 [Nitrospinaceae bacterium]